MVLVGERGQELIGVTAFDDIARRFIRVHPISPVLSGVFNCPFCGMTNGKDVSYCGQGIEPAGCGAPVNRSEP